MPHMILFRRASMPATEQRPACRGWRSRVRSPLLSLSPWRGWGEGLSAPGARRRLQRDAACGRSVLSALCAASSRPERGLGIWGKTGGSDAPRSSSNP